jgi:hypothetical protein
MASATSGLATVHKSLSAAGSLPRLGKKLTLTERRPALGRAVKVRGDRLEATSLRNAWSKIDETLRAGLTFAAWCHPVP